MVNYKIFLFISLNVFSQTRDVEFWENQFKSKWSKDSVLVNQNSLKADSWKLYELSYTIDGLTSMFRATNDEVFLKSAIQIINNIINSAKRSDSLPTSQYKDKYYGWVNKSNPYLKNDGKEYALYESYCWRNITQLLRVMNTSPDLLKKEEYYCFFNNTLIFSEVNIFKKWEYRGLGNIYRSNTHMSSHWARISMDLWIITNNKKYYKVFDDFNDKLNRQFGNALKKNNTFWWSAKWNSTKINPQDVSHGNAVISEIVEAYDLKLAFNKKMIDSIVDLFNKKIWKESNKFSKYVDGSGVGNGWFSDGFIKLGRYNAHLQKRIENHKIGRSLQFYGNGCLNAYYLEKNRFNK